MNGNPADCSGKLISLALGDGLICRNLRLYTQRRNRARKTRTIPSTTAPTITPTGGRSFTGDWIGDIAVEAGLLVVVDFDVEDVEDSIGIEALGSVLRWEDGFTLNVLTDHEQQAVISDCDDPAPTVFFARESGYHWARVYNFRKGSVQTI